MRAEKKFTSGFQRIRRLRGHKGSLFDIVWSPDGRTLATCSNEGGIYLWDVASGENIRQMTKPQSTVVSLAWSRDYLASASADDTICLWHRPTEGDFNHILEGHQASVTSLAWSPDCTILASASSDCSIRLWDMEDKSSRILGTHDDYVYSLAWSAAGYLASGGRDNCIRVWKPSTGERKFIFDKHGGTIYSVAWSRGGDLLASASEDQTIRIWDLKGGPTLELDNHKGGVRCLRFSADDRLLASKSRDGTVRIWRCDDWSVARIHEEKNNGNLGGLAFHPAKTRLATRDDETQIITIWHLETPFTKSPRIND